MFTDLSYEDHEMRKGLTRKPQGDEPATRGKNYMTPSGLQRLKDEHRFLLTRERPAVAEVVAWAATHGDCSEKYGKWYQNIFVRCSLHRPPFLTRAASEYPLVSDVGHAIACPRSCQINWFELYCSQLRCSCLQWWPVCRVVIRPLAKRRSPRQLHLRRISLTLGPRAWSGSI